MLLPSSGWPNLIHVDVEVIWERECVGCVGRLAALWPGRDILVLLPPCRSRYDKFAGFHFSTLNRYTPERTKHIWHHTLPFVGLHKVRRLCSSKDECSTTVRLDDLWLEASVDDCRWIRRRRHPGRLEFAASLLWDPEMSHRRARWGLAPSNWPNRPGFITWWRKHSHLPKGFQQNPYDGTRQICQQTSLSILPSVSPVFHTASFSTYHDYVPLACDVA